MANVICEFQNTTYYTYHEYLNASIDIYNFLQISSLKTDLFASFRDMGSTD
jgi:hypothetical protein